MTLGSQFAAEADVALFLLQHPQTRGQALPLQLLTRGQLLTRQRQGLFIAADVLGRGAGRRLGSGATGAQRSQIGLMLADAGLDHLALGGRSLRARSLRSNEDDPARRQPVQNRISARPRQAGRGQFRARRIRVGRGKGGVQLDQRLTGADMLALAHLNGADHPGLGGLDRAQPPRRNQTPLADRHHVHMAEDRPQQGRHGGGDDGP
ncbi:hypothetical protein D3C71_1232570 [compost metagenome]